MCQKTVLLYKKMKAIVIFDAITILDTPPLHFTSAEDAGLCFDEVQLSCDLTSERS